MIKFFRRIRQKNLFEGRFSTYLIYAIGEIVLVVIGILLALQINNWNQHRLATKLSVKNYYNFMTSLQQDSINVRRTLDLNRKGLDAMRKIIPMEVNQELLNLNEPELNQFLIELKYSNRSFMPNSGIYDLLTSNNGFDLVESEKIKSLLINLYDHQYRAYADLDARIDFKALDQLGSVINEKMGQVLEYTPELTLLQKADQKLFEKHYYELASESRDLYSMLSYNLNNLKKIEKNLTNILSLIRKELNQFMNL